MRIVGKESFGIKFFVSITISNLGPLVRTDGLGRWLVLLVTDIGTSIELVRPSGAIKRHLHCAYFF